MRSTLSALLLLTSTAAPAQDRDVQRALIQRDQQSAEFAAQIRSGVDGRRAMETLHERQLREINHNTPHELTPYERERLSSESQTALRLTPPRQRPAVDPLLKPLPLPGRARPGVQPIAPASLGG